MPKVSVFVTSYNHEAYVARTIESLLNQTFEDFELIIVDDGSTDRTPEIIQQFRDPRIHFMAFGRNEGIGMAVNFCLHHCSGEYLVPFSSDDVCLPDRLAKQVAFLDAHPHVAAVFGYAEIINEQGEPLTDPDHPYQTTFIQANRSRHEWLRRFFYDGNCLCGCAAMFRAAAQKEVGPYNPRLHQLQDFDMWLRMVLRHDIHILPENLVQYRIRDNEANASGQRPEAHRRVLWEMAKVVENFMTISPADLKAGFPEIEKYVQEVEPVDVPYALARIALDGGKPWLRQFGLDILYSLLDPALNFDLPGKYGYRMVDLIRETGTA